MGQFPAGMNIDLKEAEVADVIIERLQPYMDGEKEPALKNYYIILWPNGGTIGARVQDRERLGELETIMRDEIVVGLPEGQWDALARLASDTGVPVVKLGYTGSHRFQLKGQVDLPVSQISEVWNKGLEAASG